ncbi:MAG: outer membrane beta-barrel protein [Bacteroidales bacterium]|nr:outer membrane beta-barrel protein [Bacteroidales bacterium]
MKKIISVIVIILLSVALLPAQEQSQLQKQDQNTQNLPQQKQKKNKVAGGLYLKGGISWMMSDSKAYFHNEKSKMTYGFGAIMDWRLTNNFSLNIAGGFCNLGGTANFKNGAVPFHDIDGIAIGDSTLHNYKYSTSYIEIPVGIKGCTNEIAYFTYFLKLGVNPMVRVKSKVMLESKEMYIATKEFNLFNIGWYVGGGAEWTIAGNTKLLFELVYLGTFLDLDKIKSYKDDKSEFNPGLKFNDISVKVGVIF